MNMRIISIFFTILCFLSLNAQASGVFKISNIEVSGNGNNAIEAKNNAILAGEAKAFNLLLERITPSFTSHLWPQIEGEQISDLVQGMDIKQETVLSRHYEATLDIIFNPIFVEKLLKESGVSYFSKSGGNIVVIPVLEDGDKTIIWQDNAWKQSWNDMQNSGGFFKIDVPTNNSEAAISITEEVVGNLYSDSSVNLFKNIKEKYNADYIIIAKAASGADSLNVSLINLQDRDQSIQKRYNIDGQSDLSDSYTKIISSLIDIMNKRHKTYLENSREEETSLTVKIPYSNLNEWIRLRSKVESLPFVKKLAVDIITVRYAQISLEFVGGYEDFIQKMVLENLYVEKTEDDLFLKEYNNPPGWYLEQQQPKQYDGGNYEFQR